MSTYQTADFADFPGDWTATRYNTTGTWTVTSGDIKLGAGATNDWRCLSWNDLDGDANRANIELLTKLTLVSSSVTYPLFARGSGADESATLYAVGVSTTVFAIRYCSGADSPIVIVSTTISISTGTPYWIRFRVNGTAIQARIWADGASEPGTWDLDATDSTVTGVGWAGLAHYSTVSPPTFAVLGVGTNGDTAPTPTESAAATSIAFTPRFPRAILNF